MMDALCEKSGRVAEPPLAPIENSRNWQIMFARFAYKSASAPKNPRKVAGMTLLTLSQDLELRSRVSN